MLDDAPTLDTPALDALFQPLTFARGPAMKNRFALAHLTNSQSHADGRLSDEEFRWLTMRAQGGFGLVMTCAAHVQRIGQGFPGQLGLFGDEHLEGLTRLAGAIRAQGSIAVAQLHHAGARSPKELIGETPVAPSEDAETGARALTEAEVAQLAEDFVAAAVRCEKAGFDGVEIHGAHGYILAQFLSPELNRREDRYGGSPQNRARLINEIIAGIRARTGPNFSLGLRLSPERFGQRLAEIRALAQDLMTGGALDYLDMSLWNVWKEPEEEEFKGRTLMSYFTELDRGQTRLGVAGRIMQPAEAARCLELGVDFVFLGRAAILHHDYPRRAAAEPGFHAAATPVSPDYLAAEGLSPVFVQYMRNWRGFVTD